MSNSPFISNSAADAIRNAALALKAGHLVAFPTETVYGLGADARNSDAVKRIYEVKGRPPDHPLIIHISAVNQLDKWATDIPEYALDLARSFWPGPITLILKRTDFVKDFVTGGQDTVGLRVPSDAIAQSLLQEFEKISGSGIAAPSANRFGQVSPTSSADVLEELGSFLSNSDLILDGGKSIIGIESTIVDCTTVIPKILRLGFITKEEIESVAGRVDVLQAGREGVKFSGSFERHYAPKCAIKVGANVIAGAGFLALANVNTPAGMIRLGSPSTVEEFACNLYSTFRFADRLGLTYLVVYLPRKGGLASAIHERLKKASFR